MRRSPRIVNQRKTKKGKTQSAEADDPARETGEADSPARLLADLDLLFVISFLQNPAAEAPSAQGSLLFLRLVCRRWRRVAEHPVLWAHRPLALTGRSCKVPFLLPCTTVSYSIGYPYPAEEPLLPRPSADRLYLVAQAGSSYDKVRRIEAAIVRSLINRNDFVAFSAVRRLHVDFMIHSTWEVAFFATLRELPNLERLTLCAELLPTGQRSLVRLLPGGGPPKLTHLRLVPPPITYCTPYVVAPWLSSFAGVTCLKVDVVPGMSPLTPPESFPPMPELRHFFITGLPSHPRFTELLDLAARSPKITTIGVRIDHGGRARLTLSETNALDRYAVPFYQVFLPLLSVKTLEYLAFEPYALSEDTDEMLNTLAGVMHVHVHEKYIHTCRWKLSDVFPFRTGDGGFLCNKEGAKHEEYDTTFA